MVDSWLIAPLLWPSNSRMTVFQRCHVLSRLGWSAKFGGQIARSLSSKLVYYAMWQEVMPSQQSSTGITSGSAERSRESQVVLHIIK